MLGVKLTRVNWGKGAGLERMTKAVEDWDSKTGPFLEDEKTMSLPRYAVLVNIPFPTLAGYVRPDLDKRKDLGMSAGKRPLFSEDEQTFGVDVIRIHDRGNDGLNKRQCIDTLHDMRPDLTRSSVTKTFDRTMRPKYTAELTGIIKANATTVKRTSITVPQQYRWHTVRSPRRVLAVCQCPCPPGAHALQVPMHMPSSCA